MWIRLGRCYFICTLELYTFPPSIQNTNLINKRLENENIKVTVPQVSDLVHISPYPFNNPIISSYAKWIHVMTLNRDPQFTAYNHEYKRNSAPLS